MHPTLSNTPDFKKKFEAMETKSLQLPSESYTDPAYHKLEMQHVYESSWAAIGFASEFQTGPEAKPVTFLGKALLVTQNAQGSIRVFENVCRHRGHLLIEQKQHGRKLLTCPYHAWCYDLDGRFVNAPYWDGSKGSSPDPETKEKMGLIPIRFEIWYDVIFVNLDGQAKSFDSFSEGLESRWGTFRPSSLLHNFSQKNFSVDGNWKLAAENFLDNYHLPWIHPEIGSSVEASLGLAVEDMRLSKNIIGFSHPTAGQEKGKTDKPLPDWPDLAPSEAMRQDLFFMMPNICFVMEGYYLWSMILLPTGADRCDEKLALYVIGDEAMEPQLQTSRQQLESLIYNINKQDARVIKNLQAGRQNQAASQGIYCDRHDQLGKWFHKAVAERMLPHL